MDPREVFPPLNAALNAVAGVLLVAGYAAIRRRLVRLHVACMLTGARRVRGVPDLLPVFPRVVVRQLHATAFKDQQPTAPPWVGLAYYIILGSHTVLAAATAPLALVTAYLGLRGKLARHVGIARWTLPIWLYVSVTGVVVYWMLYRL